MQDKSARQPWIGAALLAAVGYVVVGVVFAALANLAASGQARFAWRLGAYLVSGVIFAVHLAYEHFRRRSAPAAVALHTALGVAAGAFGLAGTAILHAQWTGAGNQRLMLLALVLWPVITAVPVFLAGLVAAAALARMRRPEP